MRNLFLKRVAQVAVVAIPAVACVAVGAALPAHADSALAAFCADNAARLAGTSHESGLNPADWASDPKNLAHFGFSGPGDINTLYHMVIDKGAPYITSNWSNENANIQWRCAGQ